jgi:hypothetical protein
MQIFKSLRIGATLNPLLFLLGVYNFAAGISEVAEATLRRAGERWVDFSTLMPPGTIWLALGAAVIGVIWRDGTRLVRAADAFQALLDGAGPRQRTKLLVDLRIHARAYRFDGRRVPFVAGMSLKALDRCTIGDRAALSDEERRQVALKLEEMDIFDAAWEREHKSRELRLLAAVFGAPVAAGVLAVGLGWNVVLCAALPMLILGMLYLLQYGPADRRIRALMAVHHAVYRGEVSDEVQIATASLDLSRKAR